MVEIHAGLFFSQLVNSGTPFRVVPFGRGGLDTLPTAGLYWLV